MSLAVVAVVATLLASRMAYRSSGTTQLLLMGWLLVVLLAAIVGLVQLVRNFRKNGWLTLVAVMACVVALPLGTRIGGLVRDFDFVHRRMALYMAVVERIQRAEIPVPAKDSVELRPPDVDEGLAHLVLAQRDEAGALQVWFAWGIGWPVKHTWYVYCAAGGVGDDAQPPLSFRRLNANWFVGVH